MNLAIKNQFTVLWEKYFGESELPIACYYSASDRGVRVVEKPSGHSCLLAQLAPVRRGEALCFQPDSVNCGGGKRYLGFSKEINERFEYFLSNGEDGGYCEKYKQSPDMVRSFIHNLPISDIPGRNLIFKRWDKLEENDYPEWVIFFATPDVLSGLFTLSTFDNNASDSVIAPFGAGCTSIVFYPYQEYLAKRERAVIGLFDPSARKCIKENLLSFSIPIERMLKLITEMEESFLTTPAWGIINKRINKSGLC